MTNNKVMKIKNYSGKIDAEIGRGLLKAHGILSFITADDAGGARPDLMMSTGGVWLWVDKKNTEESLKILNKTT